MEEEEEQKMSEKKWSEKVDKKKTKTRVTQNI